MLRQKQKDVYGLLPYIDNIYRLKQLDRKIDSLLVREEYMWHQQFRENWLRNGDKNFKIFHKKASAQRAKDMVKGIFS